MDEPAGQDYGSGVEAGKRSASLRRVGLLSAESRIRERSGVLPACSKFVRVAWRGTCAGGQRYLGWGVQACDTAWNE
ncbi:hypothetical protein GCM10017687_59190 [Streptomyces echinatus]